MGFLMDHRHLWLRSPRQQAILRIRDEVFRACRDFFHERGFILVDTPILTPTACEGTTSLFETDYLDRGKAYLSQSGQLYLEAAAMALGRVYCFGPTFRAEKSKTRRHLTEFWMVEAEAAFFTLEDIMGLAEGLVRYVVHQVLAHRRSCNSWNGISPLWRRWPAPFPASAMARPWPVLRSRAKKWPGATISAATKRPSSPRLFDRPVLVHRYPRQCKAFYMEAGSGRPRLALCVDLLAPEGYGEIIGGSQRMADLEPCWPAPANINLPQEPLEWYLDLRRYGSVPHSGFGMGIERLVAWICGLHHVRETIPFPRLLDRLYP